MVSARVQKRSLFRGRVLHAGVKQRTLERMQAPLPSGFLRAITHQLLGKRVARPPLRNVDQWFEPVTVGGTSSVLRPDQVPLLVHRSVVVVVAHVFPRLL